MRYPRKHNTGQILTNGISRRIGALLGGGVPVPDFYVDSVNGLDTNAGTQAAPFQTLTKAATVMTAGKNLGLVAGSYWREALKLGNLANTRTVAVGTGAAPVITAADIKTGWTNDLVDTALWYVDITHDSAGNNRPVILQNSELLNRKLTKAAANSGVAGDYYSDPVSSANPLRVFMNTGGVNPNTDGKVYEVTVRNDCFIGGANTYIEGVFLRGAISNNGPVFTGLDSTTYRCLIAFGTKHNIVQGSGLIDSTVLYDCDAPSTPEPGVIPLTFFAPTQAGKTCTAKRVMLYNKRAITSFGFNHTLGGVPEQPNSVTYTECVAYAPTGGGSGINGGGLDVVISKSSFSGKISAAISAGGTTMSVSHVIAELISDISNMNVDTGSTTNWTQCAFVRHTVSGGGKAVIEPLTGQTINLTNVTVSTPSDYFGNALGFVTATTYQISSNRCLIVSNSALNKATNATLGASNNNVHATLNIGPFNTWNGTNYNLSSAFAGWRTVSSNDAASRYVTPTPLTGVLTNGDFTINTAALISAGHDGNAGCNEHWNFNTRALVSSPPTRFPVGPRTIADGLAFIADPAAWNFYP